MPTQPIADALGTPVAQNSFGSGFLLRRQRPVVNLPFEILGGLLMDRHWSDLLKSKPVLLGRFGFLIDHILRNSSQSFVCGFFFD